MCLRALTIDNGNGGISRVRRARGLSNDDKGVSRGQGIYDASEGSETTTEVEGARRQDQGIYDDNRGVVGGR